jgi:excisionase family DNA binding protein
VSYALFIVADKLLTTGQAAKLCSVTRDTVLRWVRGGQLKGTRTPGGHYRIDPRDVEDVMARTAEMRIEPCWSFHAKGGDIGEDCEECLVYKARALRCFEMSHLGDESGHGKRFCRVSCAECDYYRHLKGHAARVIVLTENRAVQDELRQITSENLEFDVAETGFELARTMESFEPDLVIIDCAIGTQRAGRIANRLLDDPKARLVRVILAKGPDGWPEDCPDERFVLIEGPPTLAEIHASLGRAWEELLLKPCDRA